MTIIFPNSRLIAETLLGHIISCRIDVEKLEARFASPVVMLPTSFQIKLAKPSFFAVGHTRT